MLSSTTVRATSAGERTTTSARGCHRGEVDWLNEDVRSRDDAGDGDDVGSVDPTAISGRCRVARLHRLVLESRVAALEARLEHKQRQVDVIRTQYERAISCRNREEESDACCLSTSE